MKNDYRAACSGSGPILSIYWQFSGHCEVRHDDGNTARAQSQEVALMGFAIIVAYSYIDSLLSESHPQFTAHVIHTPKTRQQEFLRFAIKP